MSVAEISTLAVPLMLVCLLVGLALAIGVFANEGRGRVVRASQIVGLVNVALVIPLAILASGADTGDVRWMFSFAASAFLLIGAFGIRAPHRFRD